MESNLRVPTTTSEVLLRHGYELLYSVVKREDVNVYHCTKVSSKKHLFKVEEYVGKKHNPASFNCQWLRHKNLLPYADHFEDGARFYYLADITLPSARKFLGTIRLESIRQREQLVRKWASQLVSALTYCHMASLYLTDFDWEDTVIDISNSNLLLTAFDGMTDTKIPGEMKLGAKWRLPPEMARRRGSRQHFKVQKVEAWTVGVAILDLLVGQHIETPVDRAHHLKNNLASLSMWLETLNLGLEARSFLLRLLRPKSSDRDSVEQIHKHLWLAASNVPKDVYFDLGSERLQIVPAETNGSKKRSKTTDKKVSRTSRSKKAHLLNTSHDSPDKKKAQSLKVCSSFATLLNQYEIETKRAQGTKSEQCGYLALGSAIKVLPIQTNEGNLEQKTILSGHDLPDTTMEELFDIVDAPDTTMDQDLFDILDEPDVTTKCDDCNVETRGLSNVGDASDEDYEDCTESEDESVTPASEAKEPSAIVLWMSAMILVILGLLLDMLQPTHEL